jgi:hypothetical protein
VARTIVHLVHGTWPYGFFAHRIRRLRRPESTWFHQNSAFYKTLESQLPGAEIVPFLWSGNNSYLARHVAAEQLARRLADYYDPGNPPQQIIIGHSHGGNVALLAYEHPWAPALAGIATLATPFLNVKRRTPDEQQQRLLAYVQRAAMLLTGVSASMGLFGLFDLVDVLSSDDTSFPGFLTLVQNNALFFGLFFSLLWILAGIAQRLDGLRVVVNAAPIWDFPRIAPLLILRAPNDEASAALDRARRAYLTLDCVWRGLRSFVAWIAPVLRHRWLMPLLLLPLAWVSTTLQTVTRMVFLDETLLDSWRHVVPDSGLFDLGAPFAATLFVLLVCLGAILFVAGALLSPFGWELVAVGLAFEIVAQETPPGDAYVVSKVPPTWQGRRHSLYESSEARESLVTWIRNLPPAATGPDSRYWKIVERAES